MKKLTLVIEETKTGYSAYFKQIPVYSTGRDMVKLLRNIIEAYQFWEKEKTK